MKEHQISKAYAKSIYQLGDENKIDVAKELTTFSETINSSNDLETVLFLDVFTAEEKQSVAVEIMNKLQLSQMVKNFISFLINEKRIGIFPMIFKDVIVLDDHAKGFLRGVIEGADDQLDPKIQSKIKEYLENKIGKKTELTYKNNSDITAGYRITVEDLQLDASLDNQLNKLKDNILNL